MCNRNNVRSTLHHPSRATCTHSMHHLPMQSRGENVAAGLQLPTRVVIHIDLDCFYCQVEQTRLGIPSSEPCAVQQWEGLIAVNYAARAAGVTRHMRVQQAKRMCPQLQLVHVQTIGGAAASDGKEVQAAAQSRSSAKACLQRYRQASAQIMALLQQLTPGCPFEKASIDEAYLDVTSMVAGESGMDGALAAAEGSIVLGGPLEPGLDYDRRLAVGGLIAARLRAALAQQLQYTCSAGVAANKLLAKIASARNKPNKQTLVIPRAVPELMQDLPLGKVKGLGGKLGALLQGLGAETCGQASALPYAQLLQHVPDRARWVSQVVRGVDEEPVTPRDKVKSINSCKSFEATSDLAQVARWLGILAEELAERCAEDAEDHARQPRSLVLQYRGGPGTGLKPERSIRGPMPPPSRHGPDPAAIAAAAMALFRKAADVLPVHRLALSATDFVEQGAASGTAMAKFLQLGREKAAAAAAAATAAAASGADMGSHAAAGSTVVEAAQDVSCAAQRLPVTQLPGTAEAQLPGSSGGSLQQQLHMQQVESRKRPAAMCEQAQALQQQRHHHHHHQQQQQHQQQQPPKRRRDDITSFLQGVPMQQQQQVATSDQQPTGQHTTPHQQQVHPGQLGEEPPPAAAAAAAAFVATGRGVPTGVAPAAGSAAPTWQHPVCEGSCQQPQQPQQQQDTLTEPALHHPPPGQQPPRRFQADPHTARGDVPQPTSCIAAPARAGAPAADAAAAEAGEEEVVDLAAVDVAEQARILQQLQTQQHRQQGKGQAPRRGGRGGAGGSKGSGSRPTQKKGAAAGNSGGQRRLTDMLPPHSGHGV